MAVMLAVVGAGGCEYPFQPFRDNTQAFYSIFGDLDLNADTQWVRVMPVRQEILLKPEPIDAIVTLERVSSGKIVTLRDSMFAFPDRSLEGVGTGYAHNYWTTERLQPGAAYRLRATRSDGASTSALVTMPEEMELTLRVGKLPFGYILVLADHVAFADVLHRFEGGGNWVVPQKKGSVVAPRSFGVAVDYLITNIDGGSYKFTPRKEIRITATRSDWPYRPDTKDLATVLLDTVPSNVESGFGFVGGVETRIIPFHTCEALTSRANPDRTCLAAYTPSSASISGRVVRQPCGTPYALGEVRLVERFADGGADVRTWYTGDLGEYRFEGLEPGADLILELRAGTAAVRVPRLRPGERYLVEDLPAPTGC